MSDTSNVVAAFSEEHVQRLTGLSKGRLRYWDRTRFFAPAFHQEGDRSPFSRIYSFKNLVALRTLELLRVRHGVPLQHLRKVAEKLSHLKEDLWIKTTLWVANRKVIVQEPGTQVPREVVSGQYVLGLELKQVIYDTKGDAAELRKRKSQEIGRVARTRGISRNAWVISGTRIRVDSIKRLHEDGFTVEQIIAEYPDLTEADVRAALNHSKAAA